MPMKKNSIKKHQLLNSVNLKHLNSVNKPVEQLSMKPGGI